MSVDFLPSNNGLYNSVVIDNMAMSHSCTFLHFKCVFLFHGYSVLAVECVASFGRTLTDIHIF